MMDWAAAKPKFAAKIEVTEGCWVWQGLRDPDGYGVGQVTISGKKIRIAHRAMYTLMHGPISPGLVIHHTCSNRACVNPAHLEAVTPRDNVLFGVSFAARNAAQTSCKNGHPFDEANTYIDPLRLSRGCRICRDAATKRYKKRRAEL